MEFTFKDVTQEEYDTILRWKGQISYTQDELMGMVNMNRKYVNPRTPSCLSCQGSMRTTKGELMSWFIFNQDNIKLNLQTSSEQNVCTCKKNCKCNGCGADNCKCKK